MLHVTTVLEKTLFSFEIDHKTSAVLHIGKYIRRLYMLFMEETFLLCPWFVTYLGVVLVCLCFSSHSYSTTCLEDS